MANPDDRVRRGLSRRSLWLAVGLLALVAGIGVAALRNARRGDMALSEQPAFEVRRGPLTISVTESGTIKAREQVVIKSEVEGRTTILYLIPEGTRVKKGEILVELDSSRLEDQKVDQQIKVQNAEAAFIRARENLEVVKNQAQSDTDKTELALAFAEEDLKNYVEGEFPQEVREAEAKITLAEEELQRTEEKLAWSKVLFTEKYLSQSELQADELAAKKAKLDLELVRADLDLLRNFTYQRKLAQLESDVRQSTMALERTRRRVDADIVQATADLRAKKSEFERQQSKLEKSEEQIAKTRIHAPADGMVVYSTSAKASWRGNVEPLDEGQEVRELQDLIYLPTASSFMAEVKVHESSLDKISLGLPVRITVDALPGKRFTGRVGKVAPLPDAQSIFLNPDLKVYKTEVYLDGEGQDLRTGMSCRAEIIVTRYEDATFVPVQAVLRVAGETTAYVSEGDDWVPRQVDIGLDNNRMVRVIDGLEPGERVLLTPPLASAGIEDLKGEEAAGKGRSPGRGDEGRKGFERMPPGERAARRPRPGQRKEFRPPPAETRDSWER